VGPNQEYDEKRGRVARTSFPNKLQEIAWRIMNRENIQDQLLEIILRYNTY